MDFEVYCDESNPDVFTSKAMCGGDKWAWGRNLHARSISKGKRLLICRWQWLVRSCAVALPANKGKKNIIENPGEMMAFF